MHAVADLGFLYCTPIQARVLSAECRGRNIAGRAQTGTGKTAAFLISMFTDFLRNPPPVDRRPGVPRALVLGPTRELVLQIVKDAVALSRHTGIRCLAVYGGMDYEQQRQQLDHPLDLIAATPGRLLDFMRQGRVDLQRIEYLILDEADRMLDMGFIPDVHRIIRRCAPRESRRTMLYSATLTKDVMRLAAEWMPDPVVAELDPEQVAVKSVRQLIYVVTGREKLPLLCNLLAQKQMTRVLVFANRRDHTLRLEDALKRRGVSSALLSGSVPQKQRLRILEDFREGRIDVLVATDVAARGLHVESISHVINFDLPYEPQDYVHRIGRTGRAGQEGTAISFACENESFIIPEIEAYIGTPIPCEHPEEHLLRPHGTHEKAGAHPHETRHGSRGE